MEEKLAQDILIELREKENKMVGRKGYAIAEKERSGESLAPGSLKNLLLNWCWSPHYLPLLFFRTICVCDCTVYTWQSEGVSSLIHTYISQQHCPPLSNTQASEFVIVFVTTCYCMTPEKGTRPRFDIQPSYFLLYPILLFIPPPTSPFHSLPSFIHSFFLSYKLYSYLVLEFMALLFTLCQIYC